MKEGLSNHKYTKAEVRIDLMVREVITTDLIVEIGDNSQIIAQDRITEVTILEEILEGIVDSIVEETTELKDIIITIEIGIDQEKEHSKEIKVAAEIEAQAIVDQDQGLEQIQIGTG